MEQASEKGASAWLTSLTLAKYGFNMHKQAFRDHRCRKQFCSGDAGTCDHMHIVHTVSRRMCMWVVHITFDRCAHRTTVNIRMIMNNDFHNSTYINRYASVCANTSHK